MPMEWRRDRPRWSERTRTPTRPDRTAVPEDASGADGSPAGEALGVPMVARDSQQIIDALSASRM
jgi:hypothetical protein